MILLQHIIILSIKIKQKYTFKKLYVTFVQGFGKVVIMKWILHIGLMQCFARSKIKMNI